MAAERLVIHGYLGRAGPAVDRWSCPQVATKLLQEMWRRNAEAKGTNEAQVAHGWDLPGSDELEIAEIV